MFSIISAILNIEIEANMKTQFTVPQCTPGKHRRM